ncbi:hypothetical protein [Thalassospira sp. MCCC 1A03138]|uniref:hypothetical protein n=1 Tax=Thalassospira sp. MCCC 1A03138 TaxID=1470576 RepID=UPI000A1EFBE8|nr:hypothetical protein [Thalassospira sp. MCCC 1A03138]OSQ28747.1 hypothetical protein TH468_17460 [Thalassospira sp. MCCC 1A03138]
MISAIRFLFLVMILVVPLAACGDLPRPFEGAGREGDPALLELRDTNTVRVEIGEDLPEGASVHLSRAMARALRNLDIPAYSDSQIGGDFILRPNVESRLASGDAAYINVTWVLMNPDGLAIDTARGAGELQSGYWFAQTPNGPEETNLAVPKELADKVRDLKGEKVDPAQQAYDQLVDEPAKRIAFLISGDRSQLAEAPVVKIALVDFAGAPGDGNEALVRSAGALLRAKGIEVDDEIDDRSIILSATISVKLVERKTTMPLDQVQIDWVIMDPNGTELGQMAQNNVVPHGRLDERWGSVASIAAQAAVDALEGALNQVARKKGMMLKADKKTVSSR